MPRISRACDACRTRKVRCDGKSPCAQCSHFDVQCIFSPPEKRKNPVRGRLVAKVRGEATEFTKWAESNAGKGGGVTATVATAAVAESSPSPYGHGQAGDSPSSSTASYTPEFFTRLLPGFEATVFPVNPIITADELRAAVQGMHDSSEDAALVWSFASVTIFLTRASETMRDSDATRIDDLLQRGLESHRQADLDVTTAEEHPTTIKRVVTCLFLEVAMMAFRRFERSFAILREAVGMLQILKVRGWQARDAAEAARLQRIYWEAFIHERFLTIACGYPSVLQPLESGLPVPDPSLPPHVELGFNRLICLFQVLDWPFLTYWQEQLCDTRSADITAQWIEAKQAQLDGDEAGAAEAERQFHAEGKGALSEFQHADLFVTRLWLRTVLWQLALSNGLLCSDPSTTSHEGLSLNFPARRLAAQLQSLKARLGSVASISTQGSGIVQKLFEITSTVADVLAALAVADDDDNDDDDDDDDDDNGAVPTHSEMEARVADFVVLVGWLTQFERVREEQRDYLNDKLRRLQERYPGVTDT